MSAAGILGTATVSVRSDAEEITALPWGSATSETLGAARPWRTMRWHRGQQHYSGLYWCSTTERHVLYESRLELTRLLFADHDPTVRRIVAQPFLLSCEVSGAPRKHVPDYLLLGDDRVVVVDVKPRKRLSEPEVAVTFAWTKELVHARGWRYEVWSEPDSIKLANIRFLAGFRRATNTGVCDAIRSANLDGVPLSTACQPRDGHPGPLVRAALLHLIWSHEFEVDLSLPLRGSTTLKVGASRHASSN